MPTQIDAIEYKITSSAKDVVSSLDDLEKKIRSIKTSVQGQSKGFSTLAKQIDTLGKSLGGVSNTTFNKLKSLSDGLNSLSKIKNVKISSSISNQISSLGNSVKSLSGIDYTGVLNLSSALTPLTKLERINLTTTFTQLSKLPSIASSLNTVDFGAFSSNMQKLSGALSGLSQLEKSRLGTTLNQLEKLPRVANELASMDAAGDMDKFAKSIEKVTIAIKPLAFEMEKVAAGFSALPTKIQRVIKSTDKFDASVKSSRKSISSMVSSLVSIGGITVAFNQLADTFGAAMQKTSAYTEAVNLATITLREGAQEAISFAQAVEDAMGIDSVEWIKAMGTFNQMIEGFGVSKDVSQEMSQNLTQLAYDIQSAFDVSDVTLVMDRLQSGISGQIKGMREYGVELSIASLQEYALSKGITESVRSMTQAEKASLRYMKIMETTANIQGDLARTIITPANALRILRQQWEIAQREMGKVVSVVVTYVMPAFQALVMLLGDVAKAMANALGFEMPTIDYSGLDDIKWGVDDTEDAFESATEAAQKYKKTILGIDELNLMTDNSSTDSSGSSIGGIGGSGIEIPDYSYDFLSNVDTSAAQKIYDVLVDIGERFSWIFDIVKNIIKISWDYRDTLIAIGKAVALAFAYKKISDFSKNLQTGNKYLTLFSEGFTTSRKNGESLFKSLDSGVKNVRNSLTNMQKTAIVAIAAFVEFDTVKNSIRDLATGSEDVANKIVAMATAAAGSAAAMYVALGPAGLAVASITFLVGAFVGLAEAQDEVLTTMVTTTAFEEGGIKLQVYTDQLSAATEQIRAQKEMYSQWDMSIDTNNQKIEESWTTLQTYTTEIIATHDITKEQLDKMMQAFDSLKTSVQSNISTTSTIVKTSLADAIQNANPEIASALSDTLVEFGKFEAQLNGDFTLLTQQYETTLKELAKMSKDDPARKETENRLIEIQSQLLQFTDSSSDAQLKWQAVVSGINDNKIDLGSTPEEAAKQIENFANTGKAALEDLEATTQIKIGAIDQMIAKAEDLGNLSLVGSLEEAKDEIWAQYEEQKQGIQDQMSQVFDAIQEQQITALEGSIEKYKEEYKNLGWFEKTFMYASEADYVQSATNKYKTEVIDPISTQIEGIMKDFGEEGAGWSSDAMNEIIDGMFEYNLVTEKMEYSEKFKNGMSGIIKDALKNIPSSVKPTADSEMKEIGENIDKGLASGISNYEYLPTNAMNSVALGISGGIRNTFLIHSPSKLTEGYGKNIDEGLANGISSYEYLVTNEVDSSMNSVIKKFEDKISELNSNAAKSLDSSVWKNKGEEISRALQNSITMPKLKNLTLDVKINTNISDTDKKIYETIGLKGKPSLQWRMYASGGFPDQGEMFIARERGAEMIGRIGNKTAVANNDQIVESVSQGVYKAIKSSGGTGGGTWIIQIVDENGDVRGQTMVTEAERKNRRDGKTVLPIGV